MPWAVETNLFLFRNSCRRGAAGEGSAAAPGEKPSLEVMTCTAVNHVHRRAVRFDLKIPEDEDHGDFAYRATGNAHLLPEYMQVGSLSLCLVCVFWQGWAVRFRVSGMNSKLAAFRVFMVFHRGRNRLLHARATGILCSFLEYFCFFAAYPLGRACLQKARKAVFGGLTFA